MTTKMRDSFIYSKLYYYLTNYDSNLVFAYQFKWIKNLFQHLCYTFYQRFSCWTKLLKNKIWIFYLHFCLFSCVIIFYFFFFICKHFKSFMQTFMVLSENLFALKIRIIFMCMVRAFFYDIFKIKNSTYILNPFMSFFQILHSTMCV